MAAQPQQQNVRFVRINGRIVPIRKNKEQATLKDVITKVGTVDAKKQAKKYGYKNELITSKREFKSSQNLGWFEKNIFLRQHADMALKGENAFAIPREKKHVVLVPRKVNKHVLAHEIGHTKDFNKNGINLFLDTGFIGLVSGRTLKMEKRAWDMAPGRNTKERNHTREYALKTYEKAQTQARVGAGVIVGGLAATGIYQYLKKPKNIVKAAQLALPGF